jgi:molybdopterin synthase sulfur carrier subunit
MPKINLRLFALLREQTGVDRESLQTSAQSVAALRAELVQRGGAWASLQESARFKAAINQTLAGEDHALQDGDEVAFFPPVTGG